MAPYTSACGLTTAAIDTTASFVTGSELAINLEGPGATPVAIVVGIASSGNTTVVPGLLAINSGPCIGQTYQVNLARP